MTAFASTPVASTRMYNVAPGATAAWHRLLARVSDHAGVPLQVVEHPHPAPLAALWDRPDLGCAFMCGWPLAREADTGPAQAANAGPPAQPPAPGMERAGQGAAPAAPTARPVIAAPASAYHAVFVVRAGSRFQALPDTFGSRFAFNSQGSHSGWTMPAAQLAWLGGWFSALVGPFGPHQRAAAAVAAGHADVAALDSLVWALLARHDPALAAALRVVGRTPDQPAPPLVGSPGLPPATQSRLRAALLGLDRDAAGRALLADVCLTGFRAADAPDYAVTRLLEPAAAAFAARQPPPSLPGTPGARA